MRKMELREKLRSVLDQLDWENVYEMLPFDVKDGEEPGTGHTTWRSQTSSVCPSPMTPI